MEIIKILLYLMTVVLTESLIVEVEEGALLGDEKTFITGNGSYYRFMSIPYAAPPLGPLRFRDPRPVLPWEGVRNATSEPPNCPQPIEFPIVNTSEDCLYLNVYTPTVSPDVLLPVMFYIHGGTFVSGSGNFSKYGPDFLVEKDVILVTFNYRLGTLGFLCLDIPEVPGNAGIKDQVAALRWVQKNILQFGGDPDNVTVFGHSSGAWATGLFMISPLTKYLFKKAILLSGNPLLELENNYAPVSRALQLGVIFGSNYTDRYKTFTLLQTIPAEDLVNAKPRILFRENVVVGTEFSRLTFPPVVEKKFGQERVIPDTIFNLLKGDIFQKEIIIGHTDAESLIVAYDYERYKNIYNTYRGFLVPLSILTQRSPSDVVEIVSIIYDNYFGNVTQITNDTIFELSTFISDLIINNSWQRFVRRLPDSVAVYAYLFSSVSERNNYLEPSKQYGLEGAGHLDDLNYIFNPYYRNLTLNTNSVSFKIIQQITALLTNFAKYGNPTPDNSLGVKWSPYEETDGSYLIIDAILSLGTNFDKNLSEFWQYVFEFAGFEY